MFNEVRAVPKPTHKRLKAKKGVISRFTAKTIQEIFERDGGRCVRCGSAYLESVPHHIIFRSQGGTGHKRNGVTICRNCHDEAHKYKEVRKWFEDWGERNLDQDGNLKVR